MRSVELAKVAVAAEALVLRREVRRQLWRAVYAAGAAVFGIAVLVLVHVVLYQAIALYLRPIFAALIVLGVDLVAAGALAALAFGGGSDSIQDEARQIRKQAIDELKHSLTMVGMAAELTGVVLRGRAKSRVRHGAANTLAALASRLIGR